MPANRREFMKRGLAGAAVVGALGAGARPAGADEAPMTVDQRPLGRLGRAVGILGCGLGSQFVGPFHNQPEQADAILRRALALGCNYWDTAESYGAGGVASEALIGPTVKDVRDRVFLVTKSGERSYDGFRRHVEQSLARLQTDHIDLYHVHEVNPGRDNLDTFEDGCVKAARELVAQGVLGAWGITGHADPGILAEAIRRFNPDAIMTTLPASRPADGRYEDEVLPLAREREMAIIAMKTHRGAGAADVPLSATDKVRYALSLPGVAVANVGLDSLEHLEANAHMAHRLQPMDAGERVAASRAVRLALTDHVLPYLRPGYRDGMV